MMMINKPEKIACERLNVIQRLQKDTAILRQNSY